MNVPIGHERRRRAWFSNIFTRKNNKVAPIVLERQLSNSPKGSSKISSADLEVKFEPHDSLKLAKLRFKSKPVFTGKSKTIRSNSRSRISTDMINIKLNPLLSRPIASKLKSSPKLNDFVSLVPRNKGGKTRKRKC
jgi:hypothetical protein